jgi:ECF transporter S component (folate family)
MCEIADAKSLLFAVMGGKGGIFMKSSFSARQNLYRMTLDALFVALYVVLSTFASFKIPGAIQISFSTLPILLAAFLFRPVDAVGIALLGTFVEQVIDPSPYGFVTLPMWLIPGTVMALLASLGAWKIRSCASAKLGVVLTCVTIVCAELLLTTLNTVALYIDGAILGYAVKALHLLMPMRIINGLVRAAISCVLIPLLLPTLRKVVAKIF